MAAGGPVTRLTEEATCPICLEYFNNPVTLPCGHNFCEACIARYWEELAIRATCPQCRQHFYRRSVKPNRQLANVVELVKELQEAKIVEGKAGLCDKHQEPLKLFCKDEEVPICTVCDKGKEHRSHLVIPIGEAAKEYQEKIKASVESLKQQQQTLLDEKKIKEERIKSYCAKLNIEEDRLTYAFLSLNKFLEEKDFSWQDYLEDLQREIKREEHKNFVILSEEISRLSRLITKIEDICPHPPSEYLEKTRILLSKNDLITQTADLSPSLKERLESIFRKHSALENAMEAFKESVKQILDPDSSKQALNKVSVTLDPDTASPFLVLSEEQTTVRWQSTRQELPDNPERFDWEPYVLCQEKFTFGRHCWEVMVEEEATQKVEKPRWVIFQRLKLRLQCSKWAVGVARGSVKRTGFVKLNPDNGIWAVGKPMCDKPGQFLAFTAPKASSLSLKKDPKKISVDLQYEDGRIAFFDADSNELIFTFSERSFLGEAMRPFLHVGSWGIVLKCVYVQNEPCSLDLRSLASLL